MAIGKLLTGALYLADCFMDGYQATKRVTDRAESLFGGRSDFLARSREIVRVHGLSPILHDHDSLYVDVPYGRRTHRLAVLSLDDWSVVMLAYSAYKFPPRRIPEVLLRTVEMSSRKMERCDYGVSNQQDYSQFRAQASGPLAVLTPEVFADGVRLLVPKIVALDEFMEEEGYVRQQT